MVCISRGALTTTHLHLSRMLCSGIISQTKFISITNIQRKLIHSFCVLDQSFSRPDWPLWSILRTKGSTVNTEKLRKSHTGSGLDQGWLKGVSSYALPSKHRILASVLQIPFFGSRCPRFTAFFWLSKRVNCNISCITIKVRTWLNFLNCDQSA